MDVNTISVTELKKKMESNGSAALIDVRTPGEYASVHAKGAKLVPLSSVSPDSVRAAAGNGGNGPVYLICKSGARSAQAAQKLMAGGMPNVASVAGGTMAWQAAGLPVEKKGGKVLPLDRQVQLTAGLIVLIGAALGYRLNHWYFLICAFVGLGLAVAGATGFCPMGILMAKMPWNQKAGIGASCAGGAA